jgi:DNA polymerase-1
MIHGEIKDLAGESVTIGLDTEGQGLDWVDPNYLMLCYSVSLRNGVGFTARLYEECDESVADHVIHWERVDPPGGKKKELVHVGVRKCENFVKKLRDLQVILSSPHIKKYLMNGNFDLHVIETTFRRELNQGITVRNYAMDIQAAANLVDENLFVQSSLTDLQRGLTDLTVDYDREFTLKHSKADMLAVPTEDLVEYAGADSDVTLRAGMEIKRRLLSNTDRKQARYLAKFTMPVLSGILYQIEKNGAYIDMENLPIVRGKVVEEMNEAHNSAVSCIPEEVLSNHVDRGIRLTRRDLVAETLFGGDGFALPILKATKTGASIDKETRKRLLDSGLESDQEAFLLDYNQWQELHTLETRYLRSFGKHIRSDGRIHSSYALATTVTGRVASSNPNMMNNPKRSKSAGLIRQLISAAPGKLLMAADEEQAELRWAAHLSRDPNMLKVFKEGRDIHEETAKALCGRPWKTLETKEQQEFRRNAKAVNFGLLYLMSAWGFVKHAFLEYGIVLEVEDARDWMDTFFGLYYRLPTYHDEMINFCKRHGYVEHVLGRRRRLPDIKSSMYGNRKEAERMAVNHPIQGPSSDTVLLAGNEICKEDVNPEEFKPVMFIHDELIFEVDEEPKDATHEEYANLVKHHMENPPLERDFGVKLRVPLLSDVKIGRNLNELTTMSLN